MRANNSGAGWLEKSLNTKLGWFHFTLNLNFCAHTNTKKPLLVIGTHFCNGFWTYKLSTRPEDGLNPCIQIIHQILHQNHSKSLRKILVLTAVSPTGATALASFQSAIATNRPLLVGKLPARLTKTVTSITPPPKKRNLSVLLRLVTGTTQTATARHLPGCVGLITARTTKKTSSSSTGTQI